MQEEKQGYPEARKLPLILIERSKRGKRYDPKMKKLESTNLPYC